MTQTALQRPVGNLDHLIGEGLAALDITQAEFDLAEKRYSELGAVLNDQWAYTRGSNTVFAQGSFRLGTVVRNVNRNDDIDIDVVAVRDISKLSISQEELKDEIGEVAYAYAALPHSGYPTVGESSRCWTLTWPQMHMDILPAIPDLDRNRHSLLITDQEVRQWLKSNPSGYAAWFHEQTSRTLLAAEARERKELEIQRVPHWKRRSVLQRVVQALKRHRDIYFADRLHQRPSSIVITTLAARAYAGGDDLYGALRQVVGDMGDYLDFRGGEWVLSNPAHEEENFVDAWAHDPSRAGHFFEWLREAQRQFADFETKSGLDQVLPLLESSFGGRFVTGVRQGLADTLSGARAQGALRMNTGGVLGTAAAGVAAATSHRVGRHQFAGGSAH